MTEVVGRCAECQRPATWERDRTPCPMWESDYEKLCDEHAVAKGAGLSLLAMDAALRSLGFERTEAVTEEITRVRAMRGLGPEEA